MDALINDCLIEDSINMSPDNKHLRKNVSFIATKTKLTSRMLGDSKVSG